MPTTDLPLVLIASAGHPAELLEHASLPSVRLTAIPCSLDAVDVATCSVLVVDGDPDPAAALTFCKSLRALHGEECPPVVFVATDTAKAFAHGADAALDRPLHPDELRGQVKAFMRWHDARVRLRERGTEAREFNDRLQKAYDQINLDLDFAGRLQTSFLPSHLPEVGRVRFAVHYQPHGPVGGDFYDVIRLDERHVGFYLADAMGHGVPASLLTIYLKKAVAPKEIHRGGYRIVPPDEVLLRLNRDLIGQQLAELPFVTMIYGVIDCISGALTLARAAHPHPILCKQGAPAELWKLPGTLLGAFESSYQAQTRTLGPGDRVVFLTDGLSADISEPLPGDPDPIMEALESVRSRPLGEFPAAFAERLLDGTTPRDDFSLLVLEFSRETP